MPKSLRVVTAAAAILVTLSACAGNELAPRPGPSYYNDGPARLSAGTAQTDMAGLVYRATEQLAATSRVALDPDRPVIVASLVDIDYLESSSTFGRVIGRQATGRLVQLGYHVRETTLRNSLAIRPRTGELMLTRDIQELSRDMQAQAVVAGTYGVGRDTVSIQLALIRPTDGRILSAVDLVAPLSADTRGYLTAAKR